MGKIHKIKRQFKKLLPLKEGYYRLGGYSYHVYKRFDGSLFTSHWWRAYQSLIKKLEREHLGG